MDSMKRIGDLYQAALDAGPALRNPSFNSFRAPLVDLSKLLQEHQCAQKNADATWMLNRDRLDALSSSDKTKAISYAQAAALTLPGADFTQHLPPAVFKAASQCHPSVLQHEMAPSSERRGQYRVESWITQKMMKQNPDTLYVFGDNLDRYGKGGQAEVMRDQPNGYGIPTKRSPFMGDGAFFSDRDFSIVKKIMDRNFKDLEVHLAKGKDVIWPEAGLGTKRADLANKAPLIAQYLEHKRQNLENFSKGLPQEEFSTPHATSLPKPSKQKVYAGIGSRETPADVMEKMTEVAKILSETGWKLRSGGAPGADEAFEIGVRKNGKIDPSKAEIYLGWEGFQGKQSQNGYIVKPATEGMIDLVKKFHPKPSALKSGPLALMARNGCQVLGNDLQTPADMVVCYTPEGSGSGGTGQAIRIAKAYSIPVLDLGHPNCKNLTPQNIVDILEGRQSMPEQAVAVGSKSTPARGGLGQTEFF